MSERPWTDKMWAFVWNILGAIWTHINKPEMIDLPFIRRANNE